MESLKHFILPISGLYIGEHHYDFVLDDQFFSHFEQAPVDHAALNLHFILDKRSDFFELRFELDGFVGTQCDRCTANISLPINQEYRIIVKMQESMEAIIEDEKEDVIYVSPGIEEFDLSNLAYEVACLSLPMIKTINCEDEVPKPCNEQVLKKIREQNESTEVINPLWEALKDINLNLDN